MSTTEPSKPPVVQNKASLPPGVLPRNAQAWALGVVALVMVAIIAFSGRSTPAPKSALPPSSGIAVDATEGRIKEYRERIDAGAKRLNDVRDQLAKERAAQDVAAIPPAGTPPYGARLYEYPRADLSRSAPYVPAPEKSWIEQDREKRNYQSLYAPNVALSYRDQVSTERTGARATEWTGIERALNKARRISGIDEVEGDLAATESADKKKGHDEIDQSTGSKYRLFEGTLFETVLTNRLDGVFSGPVNCMTTADIYSHNGQHVLIPAGTRVLGEVRRVDTFGQERLAVVFHRMIMPDGYTANLDKFRGLNQIGETGLRDQINHHYLQVFGVSIAIGAIAGFAQANTRSGADISAQDAYRQGVSASLSQSSLRILDRYLSVLPTLTIREGQRVKIYLADDLLLPAYENHKMPNEL